MKLSNQDNKLSEMKGQLRRLRDERSSATKKADAVMRELDSLQSRYEGFLEKVHNQKSIEYQKSDEMKDKYLHGLSNEVLWLRAKYERAEGFRADLMYIKVYFEKLEKLRVKWYVFFPYLILFVFGRGANMFCCFAVMKSFSRSIGMQGLMCRANSSRFGWFPARNSGALLALFGRRFG